MPSKNVGSSGCVMHNTIKDALLIIIKDAAGHSAGPAALSPTKEPSWVLWNLIHGCVSTNHHSTGWRKNSPPLHTCTCTLPIRKTMLLVAGPPYKPMLLQHPRRSHDMHSRQEYSQYNSATTPCSHAQQLQIMQILHCKRRFRALFKTVHQQLL